MLREQEKEADKNWIDLSSAVNRQPWPIPVIPECLWYELPDQHSLKVAATHYYKHSNFVPLAGTQQAIEQLPIILSTHLSQQLNCTKPPQVVVPKIGYQEHKFAWQKWGYCVETYQSFDELVEIDWQVLVLIQPNNPTAELFTNEQIKALIELVHSRHAYIVIDEAFIDPIEEKSVLSLFSEPKTLTQKMIFFKKTTGPSH